MSITFASFNPNIDSEYDDISSTLVSSHTIDTVSHGGIKALQIHGHIVAQLDQFIANRQIPHIIFHGPSGSGKLTLVREFIARIYSDDKVKIKSHVMTVNCSHGKGIQFIREELKFFAKSNAQSKSTGEFKIILLLNAHHLTVDAQSALRRCIELFSYNTRFFIVVENKNKLLNPILSRFCDIFVPEPVDAITGESVNLHKYVLSQQFYSFEREVATNIQFIDAAFSAQSNIASSTKELMDFVNSLYESGISCLDLMEWVEYRRDKWTPIEHSSAVMRFYQIKPQFRCEKLLMLFMLNYLHQSH